nr:hypothetical protein [Acidiphilium multivorum]
MIRSGGFRLERELPGGICTHVIDAPWQGTQWNKIEHRLFAFITMNWRGKPLVSYQVIVQLIGSTRTDTGLQVACEIDSNLYPRGIKVSDAEMQAINISPNAFHGEWNYTIAPNQKPP